MAASWYGYLNNMNGGTYIVMNYGVHAIMYFYYFLMSIKMKPKWFNPKWITIMQISQMIVGLYMVVSGIFIVFVLKPPNCDKMNTGNLAAAAIPYAAFMVLFAQFFLRRYKVQGYYKRKTT